MINKFFFDKNHGVIDKALSDKTDISRELKKRSVHFENIVFVNQVHSAEVLVIDGLDKIPPNQGLPKVDAIVTNLPLVALGVVTADCSPILLADENAQIVAAVHAGWRGAKNNIIKNAIVALCELGSKPSQISADIGPMIHQESYEVGQEFFDDFVKEEKNFARFFKESALDRYLFDLPAFVRYKLHLLGVEKITDININTYKNESYASYRRATHQGLSNYGRNASLVVL